MFTSCLRYKLLLEIQTILDAFSDENKCTTIICLFTKKSNTNGKECFLKRSYVRLLGRNIIQKTFYFKYRAPYFNKRLMFGITTNTKNNSRRTYLEVF